MTNATLAQRLADAFVGELREALTPAEFDAVRFNNATPAYTNGCASHDIVDANEAMSDAFLSVVGRLPRVLPDPSEATDAQYAAAQLDEATDATLWNEAWDIAKREHLTAFYPSGTPGGIQSTTRGPEPDVDISDRDSLIAWHVWNDPNGEYDGWPADTLRAELPTTPATAGV